MIFILNDGRYVDGALCFNLVCKEVQFPKSSVTGNRCFQLGE